MCRQTKVNMIHMKPSCDFHVFFVISFVFFWFFILLLFIQRTIFLIIFSLKLTFFSEIFEISNQILAPMLLVIINFVN